MELTIPPFHDKHLPQAWQPPIFSRLLNNWLPVGTIVVLAGGRVVRITSHVHQPNYKPSQEAANVKLKGSLFLSPEHPEPFPTPINQIFLGIRNRELVLTNDDVVFMSDDIDDYAFVIPHDELVEKGYIIDGMVNCWFIRFDSDSHPILDQADRFHSFASGYKAHGFRGHSCLPLNIWLGSTVLQKPFRSLMSRYGAKCQGDFHTVGKIRVPFLYEAFMYISYRLKKHNIGGIENTKCQTKLIRPILIPTGLIQATVRVKQTCYSINVNTRKNKEGFAGIVGWSPLMGVRARRPRVDNHRRLVVNDKVNYCAGPAAPSQTHTENEDSPASGSIKLSLDDTDLIIEVEYDTFVYVPDDDERGASSNCEYEILNNFMTHTSITAVDHVPIVGNFSYPSNVKLGRKFMLDGKLHRITALARQHERIECSVRNQVQRESFDDSQHVSTMVQSYYFG